MEKLLRKIIRSLLREKKANSSIEEPSQENLLVEPDLSEEEAEDENEYSSGGVAGATVPIGRAPTFPKNKK